MFNVIELNATVDELKPINEAITKDFDVSPSSSTESSKEIHVNSKDLSLTKEVEAAPIVNDPSPKLNRTFRKMMPLVATQNFSTQTETGNLNATTVNNVKEVSKDNVSMFSTSVISSTTEEAFDAVTEEPKKLNKKRVLISEKKDKYPYNLGRVLG